MRWPFLLLALVAMTACRKDPETGPAVGGTASAPCIPLPEAPPQGWNEWFVEPYFGYPRWNPNNPDEFTLLEYRSPFLSKLWKYNLSTHELDMLYEGNVLSPPEWGKTGWILLNIGWPANIFKIKANGDSLTQLTSDGQNFGGEWNYWGDTIVYYHADNATRLMLPNGSYVQQLPYGGGYDPSHSKWRHPRYIATPGAGLFVAEPYIGLPIFLIDDPAAASYYGISFVNDLDRIAWVWDSGLHTTRISTHETVRIEETCSSNCYRSVDCHPLNNKLLLSKSRFTPDSPVDHSISVETSIVIMNLDGTDKQTITIPFPE